MNRRRFLQGIFFTGAGFTLEYVVNKKTHIAKAQVVNPACMSNCLPFCIELEKNPQPFATPAIFIKPTEEVQTILYKKVDSFEERHPDDIDRLKNWLVETLGLWFN